MFFGCSAYLFLGLCWPLSALCKGLQVAQSSAQKSGRGAGGAPQAASRRSALGGGPGSGGWSTGGSSAELRGGTADGGSRRSSLDEAAAAVEDQRRTHTARRRAHETNMKLAVDEQALVDEEVRCCVFRVH